MAMFRQIAGLAGILAAVSSSNAATSFPCDHLAGVEGRGRLSIVFFPEAFDDSTRLDYDSTVARGVARFFEVSPYREYRDYFALYKAWIPSKKTYVGNTPSDSTVFQSYFPSEVPAMAGMEPWVRTQTDSTFRCRDRPSDFLKEAISVIFVNRFGSMGGSGITNGSRLTVLMGKTGIDNVLPHELGHALGGLVDEYGQRGWSPGAGHFDSLGRPRFGPVPNVVASLDLQKIPWKAWIEPTTPIPTPDQPEFDTVIGAFEGGDLRNTGRWRPDRRCMMRGESFGFPPFCKVCRERLVYDILRQGAQLSRLYGETRFTRLRLDTVSPVPDTDIESGRVVVRFPRVDTSPLHPRWRYNGIELPNRSDTLDVSTLSGSGVLEAVLVGESPFIRNPDLIPRDTLRWTVRMSSATRNGIGRHDGIRRMGPSLFMAPPGAALPRWARSANGKRVPLQVVATTANGTLLSGASMVGEALFLEAGGSETKATGGIR
jgi:hypothetical protein